MKGAPRESAADKEARMRERKLSEAERDRATQKTSEDLTDQLRRTYGRPSLFSLFSR